MSFVSDLNELSKRGHRLDNAFVRVWLETNRISRVKNRLISSLANAADSAATDAVHHVFKQNNLSIDLETLVRAFELCVPPKERRANGTVYTPSDVKSLILSETLAKTDSSSPLILDPSCGCGSFLVSAAIALKASSNRALSDVYRTSLFGIDIIPHNIVRAKILLSLVALSQGEDEVSFDFNLKVANSLQVDPRKLFHLKDGFDVVIGNPPYVRGKHISGAVKRSLRHWATSSIGIPDLYIPFFELGVRVLRPGGLLGYISTNSYLHSLNGRGLRNFISQNRLALRVINFEGTQMFKGVTSYTCVSLIEKVASNDVLYAEASTASSVGHDFTHIPYSALNDRIGWTLASAPVLENINAIRQAGDRLLDLYPVRNGIATLDNELFVFKPVITSGKYVERNFEGKRYKIEADLCRDILKPNILRDAADLKRYAEKVIFPYVMIGKKFQPLPEKDLRGLYPSAYSFLRTYRGRLKKRDKGHGDYQEWYCFGRTQGFNTVGKKVLIPYMAKRPVAIASRSEQTLIYCGYAIMISDELDLRFVERLLRSRVFWFFIQHTSKHYSGGFMSLAKNYIAQFTIPRVSPADKRRLLAADEEVAEEIIAGLYGVRIPHPVEV